MKLKLAIAIPATCAFLMAGAIAQADTGQRSLIMVPSERWVLKQDQLENVVSMWVPLGNVGLMLVLLASVDLKPDQSASEDLKPDQLARNRCSSVWFKSLTNRPRHNQHIYQITLCFAFAKRGLHHESVALRQRGKVRAI